MRRKATHLGKLDICLIRGSVSVPEQDKCLGCPVHPPTYVWLQNREHICFAESFWGGSLWHKKVFHEQ